MKPTQRSGGGHFEELAPGIAAAEIAMLLAIDAAVPNGDWVAMARGLRWQVGPLRIGSVSEYERFRAAFEGAQPA